MNTVDLGRVLALEGGFFSHAGGGASRNIVGMAEYEALVGGSF